VLLARWLGRSPEQLRTLAFVSLCAGNLAVLLTSRSNARPFWQVLGERNTALPAFFGLVVVTTALLVSVPVLSTFFSLAHISAADAAMAVTLTMVATLGTDLRKIRA
jgi:hypothetical protein